MGEILKQRTHNYSLTFLTGSVTPLRFLKPTFLKEQPWNELHIH